MHVPDGAEVDVVEVDRGGKSTYHAPGQLVCYPILDLTRHGQDVKKYCRDLEEALIRTTRARSGSRRRASRGLTGVWLESPPRKIASIGIHLSKWVSTHGYALNVDLDPAPFTDWITACGLDGYAFTSMARELGRPLSVDDVRPGRRAGVRGRLRRRVRRAAGGERRPADACARLTGARNSLLLQALCRPSRACAVRRGVHAPRDGDNAPARWRGSASSSPPRSQRRSPSASLFGLGRRAGATTSAAGAPRASSAPGGRAGPRRRRRRRSRRDPTRGRSLPRSRAAPARSAVASTPRRRAGRSASSCRPSCDHVSCSSSSSSVPKPPGSATNPSASSAISAFRSCSEPTTRSSVSPPWASSRSTSSCGITPITSPPAASARVGDRAHQPDAPAAVDEPEPARRPAPRRTRARRRRTPAAARSRPRRRRRPGARHEPSRAALPWTDVRRLPSRRQRGARRARPTPPCAGRT